MKLPLGAVLARELRPRWRSRIWELDTAPCAGGNRSPDKRELLFVCPCSQVFDCEFTRGQIDIQWLSETASGHLSTCVMWSGYGSPGAPWDRGSGSDAAARRKPGDFCSACGHLALCFTAALELVQ